MIRKIPSIKLPPKDFEYLLDFSVPLTLILRISVLLYRSREAQPLPDFNYEKNKITLAFPEGWIQAHPLILQDLDIEKEWLAQADIKIEW